MHIITIKSNNNYLISTDIAVDPSWQNEARRIIIDIQCLLKIFEQFAIGKQLVYDTNNLIDYKEECSFYKFSEEDRREMRIIW